jgi:uncharacterized protein YciI
VGPITRVGSNPDNDTAAWQLTGKRQIWLKKFSRRCPIFVISLIKGKLASHGPRLALEGKVLKAGGVITNGPFVEIREMLGSFIVVKADSLEEATTLAHGCPALDANGSVEIRPI